MGLSVSGQRTSLLNKTPTAASSETSTRALPPDADGHWHVVLAVGVTGCGLGAAGGVPRGRQILAHISQVNRGLFPLGHLDLRQRPVTERGLHRTDRSLGAPQCHQLSHAVTYTCRGLAASRRTGCALVGAGAGGRGTGLVARRGTLGGRGGTLRRHRRGRAIGPRRSHVRCRLLLLGGLLLLLGRFLRFALSLHRRGHSPTGHRRGLRRRRDRLRGGHSPPLAEGDGGLLGGGGLFLVLLGGVGLGARTCLGEPSLPTGLLSFPAGLSVRTPRERCLPLCLILPVLVVLVVLVVVVRTAKVRLEGGRGDGNAAMHHVESLLHGAACRLQGVPVHVGGEGDEVAKPPARGTLSRRRRRNRWPRRRLGADRLLRFDRGRGFSRGGREVLFTFEPDALRGRLGVGVGLSEGCFGLGLLLLLLTVALDQVDELLFLRQLVRGWQPALAQAVPGEVLFEHLLAEFVVQLLVPRVRKAHASFQSVSVVELIRQVQRTRCALVLPSERVFVHLQRGLVRLLLQHSDLWGVHLHLRLARGGEHPGMLELLSVLLLQSPSTYRRHGKGLRDNRRLCWVPRVRLDNTLHEFVANLDEVEGARVGG
eukprot:Hpha_TRINITY_DN15426_c2_g7::TRINITY_DN15426_c2_g7_i1::g.176556::m.176556